ncbi:DUF1905 domain-containing protein [Cryobacterium fucosi]|nr:DUF1905 domain-containing protein [Cryobacterium fucosi]
MSEGTPMDQARDGQSPGLGPTFTFTAELWEYEGKGAWIFASLPSKVADDIREITEGRRNGFGSVKVLAVVNATRWSTSVFPDGSRNTFLLPVKKAVRLAEGISEGDAVTFRLELVL